jgi:hypothetical protein
MGIMIKLSADGDGFDITTDEDQYQSALSWYNEIMNSQNLD